MKIPELPAFDHQPKKYDGPSPDEVLRLRRQFLNPGIFLYYKKPLMLVEGKMQYVWDENGKRYLDALGGIVTVSVGHCHPYVVEAAHRQNETLQHSTTIYLHPNIGRYAESLASKMPGDLKVCYFVNSGSEANDLALLMARAYTGNYEVIALRNAYHGGNALTMGLTAHRTWKFNVPHSFGVHHTIAADPYRGIWGHDDADAGKKYADDVKNLIDFATPGQVAAFIAESIQGVGGCVVFPRRLSQARLRTRPRGRRRLYCRRSPGRLRPDRHPLLGIRDPGRHSRYRDHGKRNRKRLPVRRSRYHAENCRDPRPTHPF